jgi:hypothetical protein
VNANEGGGGPAKTLVPMALTVGILGGLGVLYKTGIFEQMGKVATVCIVAGDLFVVTLIWFKALR